MTLGLPASGKSTWAREQVEKSSGKIIRVNKDDLRAMLHESKFSSANENQILRVRDFIVKDSLAAGKTVIVDDTNLHPKHEERLRELATYCEAEFEIKDFTDVPLDECLKRDALRPNPVGAKVIKKMYNDYLKKPEVPLIPRNPSLPDAILCDIDGTLAIMNGRSPFDWSKVGEDDLNDAVALVLDSVEGWYNKHIILMSGRDSVCRDITVEWLQRHSIRYDHLYMRAAGDNRKDTIIKEELYNEHVRDKYNVVFVLDDRNSVVKMWRGLGLTVFQVNEGDF